MALLEIVNSILNDWTRGKQPSADVLIDRLDEATADKPPEWWLEELNNLWYGKNKTVTFDVSRAACIALKVVEGYSYNEAAGFWERYVTAERGGLLSKAQQAAEAAANQFAKTKPMGSQWNTAGADPVTPEPEGYRIRWVSDTSVTPWDGVSAEFGKRLIIHKAFFTLEDRYLEIQPLYTHWSLQ